MESYEVPEDVVINILSRLPVKSLKRFKCVCKSWCVLIQSPFFIAKHLDNNNNNAGGGLIVMCRRRVEEKVAFFLLSDETFEVTVDLHLPYFKDVCKVALEMMGSCNGVICLIDRRCDDIFLWNPATGELKALPESCDPPDWTSGAYEVGFCFDLINNDYKVLRIVRLSTYDTRVNQVHQQLQFEIYCLSTDSWRLIDAVLPDCGLIAVWQSRTYLNGIYSWWGMDESKEEFLVSFDMTNEVFLRTPLPDVCATTTSWQRRRSFSVLNESIALILFPYQDIESCCEIWLLKEYGVKESWTKLYEIGSMSRGGGWPLYGSPLGFGKNGELFVAINHLASWQIEEVYPPDPDDTVYEQDMVLFNPVTQETKNLQIHGVNDSLQVLAYKESLVSIKGGVDPAKAEQNDSHDMVSEPSSNSIGSSVE